MKNGKKTWEFQRIVRISSLVPAERSYVSFVIDDLVVWRMETRPVVCAYVRERRRIFAEDVEETLWNTQQEDRKRRQRVGFSRIFG